MRSTGGAGWDQFAENERRFGLTTDYDENIYTTTIDKTHPLYRQRVAEAEKKAREIERSAATNSHVAEERITDNVTGDENGLDEEDKYVGMFSSGMLFTNIQTDTVVFVDRIFHL
jgi:PAB1-binding protein PBP1